MLGLFGGAILVAAGIVLVVARNFTSERFVQFMATRGWAKGFLVASGVVLVVAGVIAILVGVTALLFPN